MLQPRISFISILIFLSLLLPSLARQNPNRILDVDPSDCIQEGYYDCDICPCNLTESPLYASIAFSCFSILFTLFIVIGYIKIPDMREQPGDIVLGVAISNIVYCVALISENIHDIEEDFSSDDSDEDCFVYGMINSVALILVSFYHISFSVFYLIMLKGSLKSQNLPWYLYHIFPLLATFALSFYYKLNGGIGRNIYGFCGTKTAPGLIFPIISYGGVVFITIILTCFIKKYLPKNERISPLRTTFLKFYLYFVIILVLSYLVNGILEAETGDIVNAFVEERTTFEIIRKLNVIKNIKSVIHGTNPLLLSLARLVDPLLREQWKKLFSICGARIRKNTEYPALLDSRKVSLDLASVQRSIEKKSHIFQFQHSRKVQAVYSLLSSIHYFWYTKEEKKSDLNDSGDKPKPPTNAIEAETYYIREASVKETFPIDKESMVKAIPELFEEMKNRNYDFDPGTFTVYAPEIFEEIIQLDETGRGIRDSLDLQDNFNRILKSGINGGGRSGEFFFFSSDNKIIIKTISNSELKVLLRILPAYLNHFRANPESVIAKIYGVFTLRVDSPEEKYNLILMRNINGIPANYVRRKYDLKGSKFGRRAVKLKDNLSMNELQFIGNMKDLDFDRFEGRVHACYHSQINLIEVMKKDVEFLASQNIIDYSLALYVVDREAYYKYIGRYNVNSIGEVSNGPSLNDSDIDIIDPMSSSLKVFRESLVSMRSTQENLDYHLGIIDYLIDFSFKKKMELFLKKLVMCNPNLNISVQRPHFYANRFLKYMQKIFIGEIEEEEEEKQNFEL